MGEKETTSAADPAAKTASTYYQTRPGDELADDGNDRLTSRPTSHVSIPLTSERISGAGSDVEPDTTSDDASEMKKGTVKFFNE